MNRKVGLPWFIKGLSAGVLVPLKYEKNYDFFLCFEKYIVLLCIDFSYRNYYFILLFGVVKKIVHFGFRNVMCTL